MELKENNIAFSEEFLKKNEVIFPSIVGKNLLIEPFEIKNWDRSCRIDPKLQLRMAGALK